MTTKIAAVVDAYAFRAFLDKVRDNVLSEAEASAKLKLAREKAEAEAKAKKYMPQESYPGHATFQEARRASVAQRRHDAELRAATLRAQIELARADAQERPGPVPDEVMKLFEEWPA
jgi:hypothetical protein